MYCGSQLHTFISKISYYFYFYDSDKISMSSVKVQNNCVRVKFDLYIYFLWFSNIQNGTVHLCYG